MRALIQRVKHASVCVDGETIGSIEHGLLILLGVKKGDTEEDVELLAPKVAQLRVFEDEAGKMNRSLLDCGGAALVVSQFTLFADCRKGRRPFFGHAEEPTLAKIRCDEFCTALLRLGVAVETGEFGAMMEVSLLNDGPVTLMLDTEDLRSPRN